MSNIKTLEQDLKYVLATGEGWTKEITEWVVDDMGKSLNRQMTRSKSPYKPSLRMSNLGQPCERKLWYLFNCDLEPTPMHYSTYGKFILGDFIESFFVGLVMASGHKIEGLQEKVEIDGIVGHRDCIIDGMQFDIKSAATMSFKKFKDHQLQGYWKKSRKKGEDDVWVSAREADPFGYVSQNSSYLFASRLDPRITHKSEVGFLAVDKQFCNIAVDIYDVSEELASKEGEIKRKKDLIHWEEPPDRIPWGTQFTSKKGGEPDPNGNVGLTSNCGYCEYKNECYPGLRTFVSSSGPMYLTKVVKEPRMTEVT